MNKPIPASAEGVLSFATLNHSVVHFGDLGVVLQLLAVLIPIAVMLLGAFAWVHYLLQSGMNRDQPLDQEYTEEPQTSATWTNVRKLTSLSPPGPELIEDEFQGDVRIKPSGPAKAG